MKITLQCAYCGSEDVKLESTMPVDELQHLTIKCKCNKWLVRDGIMGHKNNVREGETNGS
jgi:hypothetical protein